METKNCLKTQNKLYRFELTLEGKHQCAGFLYGLEDTGLPLNETDTLYDMFEELPAPDMREYGKISCWFTAEGIKRFGAAIEILWGAISERNWSLVGAILEEDPEATENVLYRDEYQAIFPMEYVQKKHPEYTEFGSVERFAECNRKEMWQHFL